MSPRTSTRLAAAIAMTLAGSGLAAATSGAAEAARMPGCVAAHLAVHRAGTDAATSHRYPRFRLTNTGDHACRLYGTPTFRFHNRHGKAIGHRSVPSGQPAHVVRLAPGEHTTVTLEYVVTQVTLARQCHARKAATVTFRLAYRPHVYTQPLTAKVCTTKRYRPVAYPVGFH